MKLFTANVYSFSSTSIHKSDFMLSYNTKSFLNFLEIKRNIVWLSYNINSPAFNTGIFTNGFNSFNLSTFFFLLKSRFTNKYFKLNSSNKIKIF